MKFRIKTLVEQDYEMVWKGFNRDLFEALSPKFPKINLLRFDGCRKEDEVHLELIFPFFKQNWNSKIISSETLPQGYEFVDQGIKLPFFLSFWEHHHQIYQDFDRTFIVDAIEFKAFNIFFECLIFPSIWFSFKNRSPVYKNFFKQPIEK